MKPRMRIGLFSTDFPSKPPLNTKGEHDWGGVGEVVYNLALQLEDRGCDVYIFSTAQGQTTSQTNGGVTVHRFRGIGTLGNTPVSPTLLYKPAVLVPDLDIVHIHRGLPSGALAGSLYAAIHRTPLVFTVHGGLHFEGSFLRAALLYSFDRASTIMLRQADAITTVSHGFAKMTDYLKGFEEETTVIPNGVDTTNRVNCSKRTAKSRLGYDPDGPLVLYLGALVNRKNPGALLEAASRLTDSHPNIQVVIGGSGPLEEELRERAKRRNITSQVYFPGFIPEQKKHLYFRSADIFCLPSSHESFGLTILEAGIQGTPLLLTDIPCYDGILSEDRDCLFVPLNANQKPDIDTLQNNIDYLLSNPSKRAQIGKNAAETAKSYSWDSIIDMYIDIYQSVSESRDMDQRDRGSG